MKDTSKFPGGAVQVEASGLPATCSAPAMGWHCCGAGNNQGTLHLLKHCMHGINKRLRVAPGLASGP
eukprot:1159725-Pelagomonas_calceolata.AAC.17